MDNMQPTLQQGINSIKKGIEKGKAKLQTSQEMMALKEQVNQSQRKRAACILTLGELAYNQIREGRLSGEVIDSVAKDIIELDREIFDSLRIIEERAQAGKKLTCECGASLTPEMKFCMGCGANLAKATAEVGDGELVICKRCETQVSANFRYCNCCGGRVG